MVTKQVQRGSVTVLTLITIMFLTILATGLAGQIRTQVHTLMLAQQETRAHYAAEAGINMALAEIMNHPQNFRSQWREFLTAIPQCSTDIVITKTDRSYKIHSDGQLGMIHHKMVATVSNYPGSQAKVSIQSGFANQ